MKNFKVLFVYPNLRGMNMLPPAIAIFSKILKDDVLKLPYLIRHITKLATTLIQTKKRKNIWQYGHLTWLKKSP